jgi:hypothetical protein
MRRFVVAVTLLLAGCGDEGQEKALAQCEFSTLPIYKDGWQTWGDDSRGYVNYISTCMKAHGFDNNVRPHRCVINFFSEHNPYCYSPTGEITYFIWRVRTVFDGGLIGNQY